MSYEIVPTDAVGDKGKFTDFNDAIGRSASRPANQKSAWFDDIDAAVASGVADIGVHSAKDIPTQIHPATILFPVLQRQDPRDVFVSRHGVAFENLPNGAKIGTGSSRRRAQLKRLRADLTFPDDYKGNVTTRVRFSNMDSHTVAGVVVAAAGLTRLESEIPREVHDNARPFPIHSMVPCANQGIIVIQCRRDDRDLCNAIQERLVSQDTFDVWTAERAALESANADCTKPIGIFAHLEGSSIQVIARALSEDGAKTVEASRSGPCHDAASVGRDVGRRLLEQIQKEKLWEI
jgi:hydroxymethylbilane synthase